MIAPGANDDFRAGVWGLDWRGLAVNLGACHQGVWKRCSPGQHKCQHGREDHHVG